MKHLVKDLARSLPEEERNGGSGGAVGGSEEAVPRTPEKQFLDFVAPLDAHWFEQAEERNNSSGRKHALPPSPPHSSPGEEKGGGHVYVEFAQGAEEVVRELSRGCQLRTGHPTGASDVDVTRGDGALTALVGTGHPTGRGVDDTRGDGASDGGRGAASSMHARTTASARASAAERRQPAADALSDAVGRATGDDAGDETSPSVGEMGDTSISDEDHQPNEDGILDLEVHEHLELDRMRAHVASVPFFDSLLDLLFDHFVTDRGLRHLAAHGYGVDALFLCFVKYDSLLLDLPGCPSSGYGTCDYHTRKAFHPGTE